jgi:predicted nucleic acid-binding protein
VILADTSVWIEHFRRGNVQMNDALVEGDVLVHPFVIGELACGNIVNRDEILDLLGELPVARSATHGEVMAMIERRRLMGRGIGYVDMHLLAAVAITPESRLLTFDRRLATIAQSLGLA